MTSWHEIVREALLDGLKSAAIPTDIVDTLPNDLHKRLREAGYAIHDVHRCIRLPREAAELGRVMTPEEMEQLGIK